MHYRITYNDLITFRSIFSKIVYVDQHSRSGKACTLMYLQTKNCKLDKIATTSIHDIEFHILKKIHYFRHASSYNVQAYQFLAK